MLKEGLEFPHRLGAERPATEQSAVNQSAGHIRYGGVLPDLSRWDTKFFRLPPSAARQVDPRQLLMLELTREALEDAGQNVEALRGNNAGIFWGVMWGPAGDNTRIECHELSMIAGRTSQHYGFRGPAMVVNTATSSSLVAVHLACQALRCGETDLALAGGINLFGPGSEWSALETLGVLAPDGVMRPFDAAANGYVRGEGAGVVALKLLDRAIADGDRVYCTVLASSVKHNGEAPGMAAPSVSAQQELLEDAYSRADVAAGTVALIEAHGTGTRRGDEAEWRALSSFFSGQRKSSLLIGSVKANIGHLEGAAGIAGLIKLALCAYHGAIPPSIHVTQPRFLDGNMAVCVECNPWPAETPVAGLTSLGLSGTNCHLVLERVMPRPARSKSIPPPWLFVLSAHTQPALVQYARALLRWAETWTDADLPNICYTAALRRQHHAVRHAFACSTMGEFAAELRAVVDGSFRPAVLPEALQETVHVFLAGAVVRWDSIFPAPCSCVSLPPFPWHREQICAPPSADPTDKWNIRTMVAEVLHLSAEAFPRGRSLLELGLDSLSALDLERRLDEEFGVQLDASSLLETASIDDLIRRVEGVAGATPG